MNVCAVIVTFNPDERCAENVARLHSQVDNIIIVDNGSADKKNIQGLGTKVEIIYNSQNMGLATALNQGVQRALELNAAWILTFDQDSIVTPTFVADLFAAYQQCPYQEEVAIVSPIHRDQTSGVLTSRATTKGDTLYQPISQTITSGCLTKASVFEKIGLFRGDFFIDFIDFEFCLRCFKYRLKLIEAQHAILLHNIGTPSEHVFLGKPYRATNHSSLRRYYNARNRILVYKEYWRLQPDWVLQSLYGFLKEIVSVLLFEEQRSSKLLYLSKGIWHGLINKAGVYE